MKLFGVEIRRAEARAVNISQSSPEFLQVMGLDAFTSSAAGITVTEDNALGIPAMWAGVNFLASTIAALPLNLYKRSGDDRKRVSDTPLAIALHDAPNEGLTSFDWRKHKIERAILGGRGLTWIERDSKENPVNLWPLDPQKTTIRVENGRKTYEYRENGVKTVKYAASEIIDLPCMVKSDGVAHRSPLVTGRDTLALAIAATQFGSKFFQNGGVPPFAVTGNFQSGNAMNRAADDLAAAVKKAANCLLYTSDAADE